MRALVGGSGAVEPAALLRAASGRHRQPPDRPRGGRGVGRHRHRRADALDGPQEHDRTALPLAPQPLAPLLPGGALRGQHRPGQGRVHCQVRVSIVVRSTTLVVLLYTFFEMASRSV